MMTYNLFVIGSNLLSISQDPIPHSIVICVSERKGIWNTMKTRKTIFQTKIFFKKEWPSGQRREIVNLLTIVFVGSNPTSFIIYCFIVCMCSKVNTFKEVWVVNSMVE